MTQWTFNKTIFRFVTTALLLCASVQAGAADNRHPDWAKLEVLVDASISKNLEDVTKSAFSPFDAKQKLPLSQSVVWLRLRPENTIEKGQVLFLKILPALISEVTVYAPTTKSLNNWTVQSYRTEQLSKPIPIGSTSLGQDIYVRITSPLDLRILPIIDTKENVDLLQRISEAYIVCTLTILSLASVLALARLVIGFNLLSLVIFTFLVCITITCLVGTDLFNLVVRSDVDDKLDIFPVALSGAVFSIICIWLLLANDLFNGGNWIKAAFIFLLIYGLIFVGSFFNGNKALFILENAKSYTSPIMVGLLLLQTLQSKYLPVKTSEKLILILLIVFAIISLPNAGDFYQPLIEMVNRDNLKPTNLLILLRPVLSLTFLTLTVWHFENLRSERISSLKYELNITKSSLESESSSLALQKRFTAMLAHEIKNPLMASQMALGSIRDRLVDEDPSIPRVKSIQHSLQEIDSIIERCAEIDKYEQGYMPLVMEKFPLGDLVCIMKASHPSERIYTIARGTDENLVLRSDLYYIKSILNNLLTNALKYSVAESLVELKVEYKSSTSNNELLFSVSNEIREDAKLDSTRVFDRYYRSESAKQQSGAGLGLWLAQSMAQALGSHIKLKTDRQFVRFEFSIHV